MDERERETEREKERERERKRERRKGMREAFRLDYTTLSSSFCVFKRPFQKE